MCIYFRAITKLNIFMFIYIYIDITGHKLIRFSLCGDGNGLAS